MAGRNKPFSLIGQARQFRTAFDLSHQKTFTCDMGQLIPVLCEDVQAGDTFIMGAQVLLRFQPLVHPIMHEINIYAHYFFVPYRLLDDTFEDFLTKGVTGDYEGTLEDYTDNIPAPEDVTTHMAKYSLWDYFGQAITDNATDKTVRGFTINAFPKQAYNFIYNEYYRDQDFIEPVDINQGQVLNVAWEKDYFTAARPEQQRGTSPSFPVEGNIKVGSNFTQMTRGQGGQIIDNSQNNLGQKWLDLIGLRSNATIGGINLGPGQNVTFDYTLLNNNSPDGSGNIGAPPNVGINNLYYRIIANAEAASLFNMNDLREAIQVQIWLERNQRAGVRFTEFLRSHFGTSPRDERLDRPEYIGGLKQPAVFSEVLQTSASEDQPSPQGNLAGHGISVAGTRIGTYKVQEPGIIMGLMSVRPRTAYYQGVDKMWTKSTPYDFIFTEFAHLSEQAIYKYELYCDFENAINNQQKHGFIPIYDHYRYRRNMICSDMRDWFNTWHLARNLDKTVQLNKNFIDMDLSKPISKTPYIPNQGKRIFAVENEPGLVVAWGNHITAIRPLPTMGEPGLMDHG